MRATAHADGILPAAVLIVALMLSVAFVPAIQDSDATTDYWTYTVTSDGEVTSSGSQVRGFNAPVSYGAYNKNTSGYDTGAWGFDDAGYGPFGSFYAAFDACHGNRMICHLDPNNLKQSIDGRTSVDTTSATSPYEGHTVNIMWVLPTVYWSVDGSGNLVLTNDPHAGGEAYAHTIDGDTYRYMGIGVYEASTATVDGKTVLTSTSGTKPLHSQPRSVFREYANNNTVATADGTTSDGHAMLWNLYMWQLYRFSVLTVGGSWDAQAVFGNGDGYGEHHGSNVNPTGDLDEAGPYAGTVGRSTSNGDGLHSSSVKAFIEDAWGSLYDHVDGVIVKIESGRTQMYATQSYGIQDLGSYYTDDMRIGTLPSSSGYGAMSTSSSTAPGFWGLPTAVGGSTSSGLFDYVWSGTNLSFSSPYGFYVGGCSYQATTGAPMCGISCIVAYNPVDYAHQVIGGRLAFVFDEDAGPAQTAVAYDHSALRALLAEYGYSEDLADTLPSEPTGDAAYDQLPDVKDFRHVGWMIDGVQYPATQPFVKIADHTAESLWVGLPAVTYDHSLLIQATGDPGSVAGLGNGLGIGGNYNYEQLPVRNGYAHVGWLIGDMEVGPTDPFVTKQSHTAVSLWSEIPMVILDHRGLTDIVGEGAEGVSALPSSLVMAGNAGYIQLPDTAGYRHVGWTVGDTTVGPTAAFLSAQTHTAVSLWEEITDDGFVPIPDGGRWDEAPFIPEQEGSGRGWLGDTKNILIIAILAAIIAEMAVLAVSRRR